MLDYDPFPHLTVGAEKSAVVEMTAVLKLGDYVARLDDGNGAGIAEADFRVVTPPVTKLQASFGENAPPAELTVGGE